MTLGVSPLGRRALGTGPEEAASGAQTLTPSLFTNTQTFYAPTVTRGAVSLAPSLFTNTQTFYGPTVSATYGLTPALFTNTQTFYAATVTPGAVTLAPDLFTNSQTFYAATVVNGVSLAPSLVTNTQTFYGPTVTVGAVTLAPDLFANDNTFFGATVTGGAVVVSTRPTGGPPGKRIKFNGRFYDSVKDRYRLARDVDGYLSDKQAEQPKPPQKPKRKVIKTEVAVIAAPPVALDTSEIDELSSVLAELKARDSQLQSYISRLRAINEAMAAEEEEFLLMVA